MSVAGFCWLLATGLATASNGDPCVRPANRQSRRCAAVCGTERRAALDDCQPVDPACLESCRIAGEGCRQDLQAHEVADCTAEFAVAMAECRPPATAPDGFDACRNDALDAAVGCRTAVAKEARFNARGCRRRHRACVAACEPAQPSDDVDPLRCRDSASAAFVTCGADCAAATAASDPVCHGDAPACLQGCADQHRTCAAPVFLPLKVALVDCRVARKNALILCGNAPTAAAMRACRNDAEIAYDVCRGPAVVAARGTLAQCARALDACLGACTPAP